MGRKEDGIQGEKYYDLWIHGTAESQSDCIDDRWFQNGCNEIIDGQSIAKPLKESKIPICNNTKVMFTKVIAVLVQQSV